MIADHPERRADQQANADGLRKVTALLLAMGRPTAERLVRRLEADDLRMIGGASHRLPTLTRDVIEALVDDFARVFSAHSGIHDPGRTVDELVQKGLQARQANGAADEAGGPSATVTGTETTGGTRDAAPLFAALGGIEVEKLIALLSGENDHVIALLLSRVADARAGDILSALSPERRGTVTRALIGLPNADPLAVLAIAEGLHDVLTAVDPEVERADKRRRVAGVLNALGRDPARDILQILSASDPAEAAKLESLLFDFEDLAALDQRTRVLVLDGTGAETVATALNGANDRLREAVLSALGQRARRMAEAELASGSAVAPEAVKAARRQIAAKALALSASGTVSLKPETAASADG